MAGSRAEIAEGKLTFRRVAAEEFVLEPGEQPYDFAFALRVGALDGRYPDAGAVAIHRIASALKEPKRIFVDGGAPLRVPSAA
jgi:hypothetical protein